MISEDFVRLRTKSCSTLLLTLLLILLFPSASDFQFPVGVDFQLLFPSASERCFPSANDFQLLRCRLTWAKPKYD